jgi:hypothetical protein
MLIDCGALLMHTEHAGDTHVICPATEKQPVSQIRSVFVSVSVCIYLQCAGLGAFTSDFYYVIWVQGAVNTTL